MKVLQLTTYPINEIQQHGGQIRAYQIRKKLKDLGCNVHSVSVCGAIHNKINPKNDLCISFKPTSYYQGNSIDVEIGILGKSPDSNIYKFIKKHIEHFCPDIIFFEQPWLWPIIKTMLENGFLRREKIKLIYSSQNIEYLTKKEIFLKNNDKLLEQKWQSFIDKTIKIIFNLEVDLAKVADYILAVTDTDAQFLKKYNSNIAILPNGTAKRSKAKSVNPLIENWLKENNYLVFCGSNYQFNIVGFWEMLGPSLASFPLNCKIVTLGTIADSLLKYCYDNNILFYRLNNIVIKNFGFVSEEMLAYIIHYSKGIILPITSGGGSNLKTAEAIISGKPVVATSMACRGYEFVSQLNNFYICDTQEDFLKTALELVQNKITIKNISKEEEILRNNVYWDNTLMGLENLLKNINK